VITASRNSSANTGDVAKLRKGKMSADRPRCRAHTKSGKPCGAAPTASGLCFFHANPAKASELGRIGGRRNRRSRSEPSCAVLKCAGAASASEKLGSLFDDVLNHRIEPARANVLMKLIDRQSRVEERTIIEEQISSLQKQLQDLKQAIAMRDIDAATPNDEGDDVPRP